MIKISVKHNINRAIEFLDDVQKKSVPAATMRSLNYTARKVKESEEREVRDVFDRPTRNTQDAFYVKPATKSRLASEVGIKDSAGKSVPASKYLLAQITGGTRRLKRFEVALRSVGVLPSGYWAVPGNGAKIDAHGNMSAGQIVQILSYFRAFPELGYRANITDKRRASLRKGSKRKLGYEYFVGRPGNGTLPLGIWQRFHFAGGGFSGGRTAIRPILIFVSRSLYEKRLDFEYVARQTIEREFGPAFEALLVDEIGRAAR